MGKYIRLLRVHHYVKNLLIFAAAIFSGKFLERDIFFCAVSGFAAFCMTASGIYIINDIRDIDKDRNHPVKCKRPIASGEVTVKFAVILACVLFISAFITSFYVGGLKSFILIALYIIINFAYSLGLKNIPIIDIAILVSGFFLRLLYGAMITDIKISSWLYLSVISMAFYLALGKRRNEMRKFNNTRTVLNSYTDNFLDKNMYVCLSLALVFYSLWSVDERNYNSKYLIFTVPVVMLITMKYSLDIEGNSDGDPAEVLMNDKILLLLCAVYLACVLLIGFAGSAALKKTS